MQQEVQVYKNICTFLFFYLFFRRFSDVFPMLFRRFSDLMLLIYKMIAFCWNMFLFSLLLQKK